MKNVLAAALALGAVLSTAGAAAAQSSPISVEGRIGAAIPTGDFADVAGTAVTLGGSASLRVAPRVAVYAGYSDTRFNLKRSDATGIDSGWEIGARVAFPGVGYSPWVRGGLLVHDLRIRQGGVTGDGDSGLGFEAGLGVAYPIAPQVSFSPGISYRQYSSSLLARGDRNVSYFTLDAGVRVRL